MDNVNTGLLIRSTLEERAILDLVASISADQLNGLERIDETATPWTSAGT